MIYTIYYKVDNRPENFVGSGIGKDEEAALADFWSSHTGEAAEVVGVELYK